MSNFLRIVNHHFPEAYQVVTDAVERAGTEAFLIGASAFAVHFAVDNKPSRGTKDIDFAIYINDLEQYNIIKQALLLKGFDESIEPFTLYHRIWNTAIDIMPFGPIEDKGVVRFLERPSELVVVGFEQVAANLKKLKVEEQSYRVSTLAGIVLLKTIAYMDRPEHRGQDIDDILKICASYYELKLNSVFDKHLEIIKQFNPIENLYKTFVGAACINKEIRVLIQGAPKIVLNKFNRISQATSKLYIQANWTGKLNDEEGACKIFDLLYSSFLDLEN